MSDRPTTRSSARQAARQAGSSRSAGAPAAGPPAEPIAPPAPPPQRRADSRKRKADLDPEVASAQAPTTRRSKRAKVPDQSAPPPPPPPAPVVPQEAKQPANPSRKRKGKQATTMSSPEYAHLLNQFRAQLLTFPRSAAGPSIPPSEKALSASSSRKSSRSKKNPPGM